MKLVQLLVQSIPGSVSFLITKGIDLPWEELTHLKYMLEDITDSTKTGIVNAKRYYK